MSPRALLDRFLWTDPADSGCGEAMDRLAAYTELQLAGADPARRYPGIAAHLRGCAPCADDHAGLLAAAGA